ncbi:hypothetical protein BDF21DRAFT_464071 [Thamnidium elegans]|nr:hypothetical protein BDF21DRAFT_464071 [Thamnidium elegans]
MNNTTRDMALCMFYYMEFIPENIDICEKRLREASCEICYNVTPNQPVLVTHQRILGNQLTYRKYLDVVPVEEAGQKRKRLEFQTEAQVVQFVNNIYCIEDQGNIKKISSLFENKTLLSFARWCSTNKASFLKAKEDKNSFML